ncbi:hypothetical protein BS17DRAFT_145219 [Gyrodon lividus]|nr:hypothetical protein BS17DRAFT_145219 [Gyrodon lividus]
MPATQGMVVPTSSAQQQPPLPAGHGSHSDASDGSRYELYRRKRRRINSPSVAPPAGSAGRDRLGVQIPSCSQSSQQTLVATEPRQSMTPEQPVASSSSMTAAVPEIKQTESSPVRSSLSSPAEHVPPFLTRYKRDPKTKETTKIDSCNTSKEISRQEESDEDIRPSVSERMSVGSTHFSPVPGTFRSPSILVRECESSSRGSSPSREKSVMKREPEDEDEMSLCNI